MVQDDDPPAPYKVYEGDELKGTYATRAEARRLQQQLESQQTAGSEPQRHFIRTALTASSCELERRAGCRWDTAQAAGR
jgi:hypothetical protein